MGVSCVRGARIAVSFDSDRCIHARWCVLGNPRVFVPGADGQWIFPDNADANEVEAIVRRCPSGALTFERLDGAPQEAPPLVNSVRVRENGPLELHGDLHMPDGSRRLRATVCRCGQSQARPYCDGSHAKAGFVAPAERTPRESEPLDERGGPLLVSPRQDGPLALEGPQEILSGGNSTLDRCTRSRLCRCGHSGNKPFCDGSHARVGFKAEGTNRLRE